MKRYAPFAASIVVAALALWHPGGPAKLGFAALTDATPAPHRRAPRTSAALAAPAVVYVAGAVSRPGLYRLPPGARADDAVRSVGGTQPGAHAGGVNLAARVADSDEIVVPRVGDLMPGPVRRTRAREDCPRRRPPRSGSTRPVSMRFRGLGPAVAACIVAFRETDGSFANLDELLDVNGMTPALLERAALSCNPEKRGWMSRHPSGETQDTWC